MVSVVQTLFFIGILCSHDVLIASSIVLATFITMEGVRLPTNTSCTAPCGTSIGTTTSMSRVFRKERRLLPDFAVSSLSIITGSMAGDFRFWIGMGIAAYGLCYFLVHDVFIHRRFSWFRNAKHPTSPPSEKHKVHHKQLGKEDGECFGMLWVPVRYFREARKAHEARTLTQG